MVLFNLAFVAGVFLRRFVKRRFFSIRDERRLLWVRIVEEALEGGGLPERVPSLRFGWERAVAEEVLFGRWRTATEEERARLQSLFRAWGLFDARRARLHRGGKWEQARSALVLGRMQCHDTLPDLLGLLHRAQSEIQAAVLNALDLLGDPEAIEGLVSFLIQRRPRETRPVLSALIRCGEGASDRLLPFLDHPLPLVRAVVAAALAEVVSPRDVTALIPSAADADPEVRAKVARALGRTGDPRAFEAVERLAVDPVWYVRLQAIDAFSRIRLPEVHDRLLWAMRDRDWRVRQKAATAIHKFITDPVYLLERIREELDDRYALEALITVLEREGKTWEAINRICSPISLVRENSQELIIELLRAQKFAATLSAIELHPDRAVRRELLRLVDEHAGSSARAPLQELLESRTLDAESRRDIEVLLARPEASP